MKAIFFENHGEIDVLKYADLPDPTPKPGEALIKVRACALNHLDIWVRRGWPGLRLEMPHITGSDVVGEIHSVNANSQWKPGTRVMINPGVSTSEDAWTRRGEDSVSPGYKILGEQVRGGMAEFVSVPVGNVFEAPENVEDESLAASLLVGVTCWRMLFKQGRLTAGETVLIVGAGGGVNSMSIALAAKAGARVFVLAGGSEKARMAEELGAETVIDYHKHDNWDKEVLKLTKGIGVDLVVDNVGAPTIPKSLTAVTRGGRIVTVGNTKGFNVTFDNRALFSKQVSLIGSTMGSKQDFIDSQEFIWSNDIKPVVDSVEQLKDGIQAIKRLEDGKQFGKIVLKP